MNLIVLLAACIAHGKHIWRAERWSLLMDLEWLVSGACVNMHVPKKLHAHKKMIIPTSTYTHVRIFACKAYMKRSEIKLEPQEAV